MSKLKLFNTLSRQIEEVAPLEGNTIRMYACGPTVYNYAHIGNFRTFLFVDLLRRSLKFFGFDVKHVMNFTDVDDKTIRGARQSGISLEEFTEKYSQAFLADMATLHIEKPEVQPRATQHIRQIIVLIERLLKKGTAYISDDGSVYYRIVAFPQYGCLCHLDKQGLIHGARVTQDEYQKESFGDFVLWKKWTETDGPVGWESPWGKGRPGWHIECSAMSMEYLGESFDIHCAASDLIFPHHENEIAQSEGATGKPFVKLWCHAAHLLVDGRKMSKSEGNLYTVAQVLERGYTGRDLRYALLSAHYRQNQNFTWKTMDDAKANLARIDAWRSRFASATGEPVKDWNGAVDFEQKFNDALADDLNLSAALGHLFDLIRDTNKLMDEGKTIPVLPAVWTKVDSVLGVGDNTVAIPAEIQTIVDQRAAARKAKDWAQSDALRKQIEGLGWKLKDTPKGQEISKI
jgi:cysteinyl-tRNA synthetase